MTQELQMNIVDGGEFFAHEATVNFTPLQFTLDFKTITPRSDPRAKGKAYFVMRHNCIMLEPWHAKMVHEVLGNMLAKYEEDFGKITKPKSLAKAEKRQKQVVTEEGTKTQAPAYFG